MYTEEITMNQRIRHYLNQVSLALAEEIISQHHKKKSDRKLLRTVTYTLLLLAGTGGVIFYIYSSSNNLDLALAQNDTTYATYQDNI